MSHVLVVDDSPVDRRLAGRLIEKNAAITVDYAAHGKEALTKMAAVAPDVVVTDLQMPEMDGLTLVAEIRQRFPLVPVVLMTAHGREELAVRAMQTGASGYVPKSELARDLLPTVDAVAATARADRHHRELTDCVTRHEFTVSLPNEGRLIPPLVDRVQQSLEGMGLVDDTGRIRAAIAIEEALANALYHGNLELTSESHAIDDPEVVAVRRSTAPYRDRRVHVHVAISRDEARIAIRDEGSGFDPALVPDPTDPANMTREHGRGLLLMRMFMDDVTFNDGGREVVLVKRRDRPAAR